MSKEEFSMETLETCSYRYLQNVAKSLGVPSNVKKVYLVQLIYAKKYLTEAMVKDIVATVKRERLQLSSGKKKKPMRNRIRVQGSEITSTHSGLSPPISLTPRRPNVMIRYTKPQTMKSLPPKSLLPPKRSASPPKPSDRVLRSYNIRSYQRPNYNIMDDALFNIVKFQKQRPIQYPGQAELRKQQLSVALSARAGPRESQLAAIAKCLNAATLTSIRPGPGLLPLLSPDTKTSFEYYKNIGFRRTDGRISKINALVQKSNKTYEVPASSTQYRNVQVTIQDIINSTFEAKVSRPAIEYMTADSGKAECYPSISVQTETGPKIKYPHMSIVPSYAISKSVTARSNAKTYMTRTETQPTSTNTYITSEQSQIGVPYSSNNSLKKKIVSNYYRNLSKQVTMSKFNTSIVKQITPDSTSMMDVTETNTNKYEKVTVLKERYCPNASVANEVNVVEYAHTSDTTDINYPNLSKVIVADDDNFNKTPRSKENNIRYPISYIPEVTDRSERSEVGYSGLCKISQLNEMYPNISTVHTISDKTYRTLDFANQSNYTDTTKLASNENIIGISKTGRINDANYPNMYATTEAYYNDYPNMSKVMDSDGQQYVNVFDVNELSCGSKAMGSETDTSTLTMSESTESYYDDGISLTDSFPTTSTQRENMSDFEGEFTTYFHRKTSSEQAIEFRSQKEETAQMQSLPRINEVFTQFVDYGKDVSQPLYIQVGENSERTCGSYPPLERLYNLPRRIDPPARDNTKCTYAASIRPTPAEQPSLHTGFYIDMHGMISPAPTIPEMLEDALEIVSQDGDLTPMEDSPLAQCPLCARRARRTLLHRHARAEHGATIECTSGGRVQARWSVAAAAAGAARAVDVRGRLYALTARYCDPDQLSVGITAITSTLETHVGSITIYNTVTGEPYTWQGVIQDTPTNIHDDVDGLKVQLSKLELLPNSANLKLINRKLVLTSPTNAIVGRPELSDLYFTVYARIF